MQKQEFEERIERTVTDEQYKVIEEVYMWHPSIRNTSGKDEVAELYKSFGMTIFHDMLPRAKKAHELDELLRNAQREVQRIQEEIEELKKMGETYKKPYDCFMNEDRYFKAAPPKSYATMLMMKSENVLVRNIGITKWGYEYRSDELCDYIGRKVDIKYDPDDMAVLYVFDQKGKGSDPRKE